MSRSLADGGATTSLSAKQTTELHKAMLDYLHTSKFFQARDMLKAEVQMEDWTPDSKNEGMLAKKWTSVIRQQKKIMDLETKNAQLTEELSSAPSKRPTASSSDWTPRLPAKHSLTGHRGPITRVTFHPLFSLVISASEDASIKVWDWETGDFERTVKGHTKAVNDVDLDSKGNFLVSCSSDLTLKIWDTNNDWKNVKTLYGHDHSVSMARYLPSDDFIVSASRDKTIRIWEVASGYCVKTFSGHSDWVKSVISSTDGSQLISCCIDHTSRIWDRSTGETKMELRGHEHVVEAAIFAPFASYAALRELGGIAAPSARDETRKIAGSYAATCSRDKTIKLWDVQSGQCLKTLVGHDSWVRALVFHPSGKFLLSASDDHTLRTWDLSTGRCIKTVVAHSHFVNCMAWGRAVAPGSGGGLTNGATSNGKGASSDKVLVNVMATGSVDMSLNIWMP